MFASIALAARRAVPPLPLLRGARRAASSFLQDSPALGLTDEQREFQTVCVFLVVFF